MVFSTQSVLAANSSADSSLRPIKPSKSECFTLPYCSINSMARFTVCNDLSNWAILVCVEIKATDSSSSSLNRSVTSTVPMRCKKSTTFFASLCIAMISMCFIGTMATYYCLPVTIFRAAVIAVSRFVFAFSRKASASSFACKIASSRICSSFWAWAW